MFGILISAFDILFHILETDTLTLDNAREAAWLAASWYFLTTAATLAAIAFAGAMAKFYPEDAKIIFKGIPFLFDKIGGELPKLAFFGFVFTFLTGAGSFIGSLIMIFAMPKFMPGGGIVVIISTAIWTLIASRVWLQIKPKES